MVLVVDEVRLAIRVRVHQQVPGAAVNSRHGPLVREGTDRTGTGVNVDFIPVFRAVAYVFLVLRVVEHIPKRHAALLDWIFGSEDPGLQIRGRITRRSEYVLLSNGKTVGVPGVSELGNMRFQTVVDRFTLLVPHGRFGRDGHERGLRLFCGDPAPIDAVRQNHFPAAGRDHCLQAFRKRFGVVRLVVAHRSVVKNIEHPRFHGAST